MSTADILVLSQGVHGMPIDNYANAIRDRLPDKDVRIARTPAQARKAISEVPIVTGLEMDRELLEEADSLELFAGLYAGTDHLPMEEFDQRGIAVTNASGVHGPNAAEQAIGLLLALIRGVPRALNQGERGEWRHFGPKELNGSTITVIGLGPIGEAIIDRLEPFGVDTIGARYTPEKGGPADEIIGMEANAIHSALAESDGVILACPLTELTRNLIDSEAFATMPPTAVLINIARGPVVDTSALVSAIQKNHIDGAGLDVTDPEPLPPDHPLWTFGNVIITPHNAGYTPYYYERVAEILAENVSRIEGTGTAEELRNQAVFDKNSAD